MTLYEELKAAGVPMANHESDLYVPALPAVWAIVKRHPVEYSNASTFQNQAEPHKSQLWIDIPFAYAPWWEARANPNAGVVPAYPRGRW